MKGIAELGECAASLDKPSGVQAQVVFRADGAAERVMIRRTSATDCRAVDCVRRHLARVKVPVSPEGKRSVMSNFVLRREPAPDGHEKVRWEDVAESELCTDPWSPATELGLTRDDVWTPVQQHFARLRACYESGLARNDTIGGRVILVVMIDLQGRIEEVTVAENQLADCDVVACIVGEFRGMRLPPPQETFGLSYPLIFEPGKDPELVTTP